MKQVISKQVFLLSALTIHFVFASIAVAEFTLNTHPTGFQDNARSDASGNDVVVGQSESATGAIPDQNGSEAGSFGPRGVSFPPNGRVLSSVMLEHSSLPERVRTLRAPGGTRPVGATSDDLSSCESRLHAAYPPSGVTGLAQFPVQPFPTELNTYGDQLIYFYDLRPGRSTFLTVGNPGESGVVLEVVFYSESLERIAEQVEIVPAFGATVLDPGQSQGVPGTAGLVVMTPITGEADHTPIVPMRPLVGGFSIVNLALGAGTGGNPFGRLATNRTGANFENRGAPGATVDGLGVAYQNVLPTSPGGGRSSLTFPVYFNPNTLSPADLDGNRLFFASFSDRYASPVGPEGAARFSIIPDPVLAVATFYDASGGDPLLITDLTVGGVRFETLQALAGETPFTSSGRLEISYPLDGLDDTDNFFGMASQSLGTFSIGQRLVPTDYP